MHRVALGYPRRAMDGGTDAATWLVGSAAASLACTGAVRAALVRLAILDHANERSSHVGSVPRGGGAVFAALSIAAWAWLGGLGGAAGAGPLPWQAVAAGACVAAVGIVDDARGLPARVRLAVHLASGAMVAWAWGPLPALEAGGVTVSAPLALAVLAVLAVAWSINLTNFMDGIDGIAASHSVVVLGFLGVAFQLAGEGALAAAAAATCGGALGFLAWNLSRRWRIFMGDGGSGFLGFAIAAFSAAAWSTGALGPWQCVAVSGTFMADATVTLVRRWMRREALAQAHRSHAYQHLSRRWASHRGVAALFVAVDLLWCVPLAVAAGAWPSWAPALAALAVGAPAIAAWRLGAGQDCAARAR